MKSNTLVCSLAAALIALTVGCSAPTSAPQDSAAPAAPPAAAAQPVPPTAPAPATEPTTAQPEEQVNMTRPSYDKCLGETEGVTPAIQECVDTEYEYQDKRLNDAYKAVLAKLPADRHDGLREQQRAWIKKRDADCETGPEPGQGQVLEANACLVDMTAARAGELEAMASGTP
jgi:uncharacterized protein YecT (DUF1311 family)